jgi:hypothetical protein
MSYADDYDRTGNARVDSTELATAEETAELRGEALVWQIMLHQAGAQIGNLASHPHGRLRRHTLDLVAEHLRSAEYLLRALDDVLDPKQSDYGRTLSVRHLTDRVDRERHALNQALDHTPPAPACAAPHQPQGAVR